MNRSREKELNTSINRDAMAAPLSARRRNGSADKPQQPITLSQQLATFLNMAGKQQIGIGSYAQVYKIYDKRDSTYKALRHILKKDMATQELEQERDINEKLMKLEHNNILKVFEIFQDSNDIYYLVEYCQGGSLWDALNYIKGRRFNEKEATLVVLQIAKALEMLHQNGITHRDLKPQNILLKSQFEEQGKIPVIKLADFGLSTNKALMETIAGTKQYIAPEQIRKEKYTKAVDIWALGIIFDELIHGVPYFTGQKHQEVFNTIITKEYRVRNDKIKSLTKSLLTQMLRKNPYDRPKIADVVQKLTDIVETFDFYEKKRIQDKPQQKLQKTHDRSTKNIKEQPSPQKQVEQIPPKKDLHCQKHPNQIKLYRRNKDVTTCRKCLESDKNIVSVEQYVKRLKVQNKISKDRINSELQMPTFNASQVSGLMKNDKLVKQFNVRKEQMANVFNRTKTKYNFLNISTLPLQKKELLDHCKEDLKEFSHNYSKTVTSSTEFMMASVDVKLQKYLDTFFRQIFQ